MFLTSFDLSDHLENNFYILLSPHNFCSKFAQYRKNVIAYFDILDYLKRFYNFKQ